MRQIFDSTYSNSDLLSGIAAGDADCASEFYRRYGKRVSQLVRSLLGADAEYDDVVQLVFVNILGSLPKVRDASRLDYWVDSVTFRTVYKELRGRRYRRQVIPASDIVSETIDERNPEAALIAKRFYSAMELLSSEDRMVLVLKYFENCTLLEISEISGWSIATVKRRVKRAAGSFEKVARADAVLASCIGEKNNVG